MRFAILKDANRLYRLAKGRSYQSPFLSSQLSFDSKVAFLLRQGQSALNIERECLILLRHIGKATLSIHIHNLIRCRNDYLKAVKIIKSHLRAAKGFPTENQINLFLGDIRERYNTLRTDLLSLNAQNSGDLWDNHFDILQTCIQECERTIFKMAEALDYVKSQQVAARGLQYAALGIFIGALGAVFDPPAWDAIKPTTQTVPLRNKNETNPARAPAQDGSK